MVNTKKLISVSLLTIILLSLVVTFIPQQVIAASTPIKDGNSVYIQTNDTFIKVEPHTLTASGWVTVQFMSTKFTGDVDILFGFNGYDQVQTVSHETWEAYDHVKTRQIDAVLTAIFKPTRVKSVKSSTKIPKFGTQGLNAYTSDVEYEIYDELTKQTKVYIETITYDTYDVSKGEFTYKYNGKRTETYTENYIDWKPSDNQFSANVKSYVGANKWQGKKYSQAIASNQFYSARFWVDIPFKGQKAVSGKFNVAIKPSSLTLDQAIASGNIAVLDPWYSASWAYRKSITVSNASADYQTKVLIGKTSGATGEDVDCNGHCLDTFADLRFTSSDGSTLLDYWIESVAASGTSYLASVWVQNDGTPSTTIYMYYGNAGASTTSSGANTFIQFDDFERGTDGDTVGGSWTEVTAHVHISTDHNYESGGTRCMKNVGAGATYPQATIPQAAGSAYAVQFRIWKEDAADIRTLNHGNGTRYIYVYVQADDNIDYWDVGQVDTGANLLVDQWDLIGIQNINFAGNSYDIMQAGSVIKSGAAMYTNAGYNGTVGSFGYANAAGVDYYIDDYIVRKWAATEQTFSAFGSETSYPTCTLSGTVTASIVETDITAGGKTIILTMAGGDTWVAAGATFDAQRQNIINGLTAASSPANGWNNEVKAKIPVTDVVRTNNTVVTITLSAEAGYNISAQETITATIPATALTIGTSVVASPTFTIDPLAPLVTTQAASLVEETTATGNGNITDLKGGGNATIRGFQYDIDSGAPYANDIHENGSFGVGAYTLGLTGLTRGEKYYLRAYATSPLDTGYGAEVTFLTKPNAPTAFTATATSETQIDLAWTKDTCGAGTTVNTYVRANLGSAPTFTGAGGTTIYDSTGSSYNHAVTAGQHWYYRIWTRAVDGALEQYSDAYAEDDDTSFVAPTVTTGYCSGFGSTWAIINGNITAAGTPSTVTTRGFDYGLTTGYGSSSTTSGTYSTGTYSITLTGLTPGTTYHYRAKATNGAYGYGANAIFTTKGSPTHYVTFNTGDDNQFNIYGVNYGSQTFTTPASYAYTITSVNLKLLRVLSPGTITVQIKRTSGGSPTGEVLCSGTIDGNTIDTSAAWYQVNMTTETSLEANTVYAIIVSAASGDAANYVRWRYVGAGGYAGGNALTSTNSGTTWSSQTYDFLFEVWGNPCIQVENAKVFTSYQSTGDWLVTLLYKNVYPPYYQNKDNVKQYFMLQLVDGSGVVKSQVACPEWDYKPGSIYLNASQVSSLTYGGAYYVRLKGNITGSPYIEYAIQSTDWMGSDLTRLDDWVVTSADLLGVYYNTAMTTYVADRGKLLNATGGVIFANGITGLTAKRPNIFQIYSQSPTRPIGGDTGVGGGETVETWQGMLGPYITEQLTNAGNVFGVDGKKVGGWIIIVVMVILMACGLPTGHVAPANVLALPIFFMGLGLRLLDWATGAVLIALMLILLWYNIWFKHG